MYLVKQQQNDLCGEEVRCFLNYWTVESLLR